MDLSTATGWTLAGLGGLFSLLWCGLHATGALAPLRVPRLAAIVLACDELDALEVSVRSLLAQDLPELDRSTDGTSGLAGQGPRSGPGRRGDRRGVPPLH